MLHVQVLMTNMIALSLRRFLVIKAAQLKLTHAWKPAVFALDAKRYGSSGYVRCSSLSHDAHLVIIADFNLRKRHVGD